MIQIGVFVPFEYGETRQWFGGTQLLVFAFGFWNKPVETPDWERRPLQANSLYYKELAAPGKIRRI
jgi:hypothetical protein